MASTDEFAIPTTILRHSDLASTPWTESASREVDERRKRLPDGRLFFDRLLAFAELDGQSLYPPRTPAAVRRLLHAVHSSPPDRLKRDCFFYYLLKDYDAATPLTNGHEEPVMDVDGSDDDVFVSKISNVQGSGKAEAFAKKRCMPKMWRVFIDGYWALDHGLWEIAASSLSDPSITEINFAPEILHTLASLVSPPSHACKLLHHFLSSSHLNLQTAAENDIRLIALASAASIPDAFTYIRSHEAPEERGRMREAVWCWTLGAPRTPCGHGQHGVQSKALKELLHLPLAPEEDSHLIEFLSHPPRSITPPALSLLHDMVTLRLIHQGQYQASLQLDRQLAGSGGKQEDKQRRREMVREFIAILPEAQRRALLVDVEASAKRDEGKTSAVNGYTEDVDMGSSWVKVNGSASNVAESPAAPITPAPLPAPTPIRATASFNNSLNAATGLPLPASPAVPERHNSPFAGPPRFAPGASTTASPRRVMSGSPFTLPPNSAAARAKASPAPALKTPRQIINDDDEEEGQGRRSVRGAAKGRTRRQASMSVEPRSESMEVDENRPIEPIAEEGGGPSQPEPPRSTRRTTRRMVSNSSQAAKETTPPPALPSPRAKKPTRSSRQSTAPPTTPAMPGAFDGPSEPPIDEEMPPPASRTRATSAKPESGRGARSRITRSASRALLTDFTDDEPPSKKTKPAATATGGRKRRGSIAASEITDDGASVISTSVRRSTRRGGTAQPSEQGSPTPSIGARSDVSRRRTATREGSMTPRISTRSRRG
ncbi:hypothetical protein CI109_100475 [Kwoniella shandongensis]|uniref:Uncharacterized protein n=1 Tax=Kwoniella shandongensis TaxID=1734106 RepID=A0A5M6C449_9TREE|nr:uncharacterized protein CI109_001682 [Kwoniella shandongensis]KAA5529743.1 hypothetical protein CI109_001682 [Kwoniella shandongensis]